MGFSNETLKSIEAGGLKEMSWCKTDRCSQPGPSRSWILLFRGNPRDPNGDGLPHPTMEP